MRNIFRVFTSDAKRLATNVVAVVVIMGLSVIPSLYAWFNILSNWDPYGEEATSNLNVVVASCDQGVEIEGIELNIGDMVVSNLKENKSIGWVFVDTEQEAVQGVYSGDYYAALVIDETFSADMISFLGGNIQNPQITYYENEKKNAIAPKITGKVKTTVQEEINSAFVSTMAKSLMEASEHIVSTDGGSGLSASVLNRLEDLDTDLNTYITIVDSYIGIMDSAGSLMEASNQVTEELKSIMQAGRSMMNGADVSADNAADSIDAASDMVGNSLDAIQKQLDTMQKTMKTIQDEIIKTGTTTSKTIGLTKDAMVELKKSFDSISLPGMDSQKATVDADFDKVIADLDALQNATDVTVEDTKVISQELEKDFDACNDSFTKLNQAYKDTVDPQLKETMRAIQKSISEVQQILNYSSDSIDDVAGALGSYPAMMSIGKDKLVASRDAATDMESKLQQLIQDMKGIETNKQYNLLVTLIESDPELIADFISSPVNLEQRPIYEMDNNGSATAPFYVVLSIWFGALILIAIIHTEVKSADEFDNLKNYQRFFGRYIVFFLIGQLQTVITVLGCLLYVGIQCDHPLLFWLAASFTSFTFTLFMYSLAYAFGNVGEAAAVILMVIQVAGSGGTFPVEVLPKVFQYLYKYMPFAHGMNAIREAIAGMHGKDYWVYLAGMISYIATALVFGLLISVPCKKLNKKIEESKERTDLLL
ncbi:MAG: YhgE/Pip domain-containing protein [Lachnospiraceae bacterium]|nr:YhgE/Pip domain-containing protein [Lachnospiraceae bacterium]